MSQSIQLTRPNQMVRSMHEQHTPARHPDPLLFTLSLVCLANSCNKCRRLITNPNHLKFIRDHVILAGAYTCKRCRMWPETRLLCARCEVALSWYDFLAWQACADPENQYCRDCLYSNPVPCKTTNCKHLAVGYSGKCVPCAEVAKNSKL